MVVVVVLAMLPTIAVAGLHELAEQRRATKALNAVVVERARLLRTGHEGAVEGARQVFVALAQLDAVQRFESPACAGALRSVTERLPTYGVVGVSRLDGRVACSSVPLPAPLDVGDRLYFRKAVDTRSFVVGEYLVSRIDGDRILTVAAPLVDVRGALRGVMFAGLKIASLGALANDTMPAGSTVTVLDAAGEVVARYPEPQARGVARPDDRRLIQAVQRDAEGNVAAPGPDGALRMYGFTRLGTPDGPLGRLFVAVGVPAAALYAEARRDLVHGVLMAVLTAVLLSLLLVAVLDRSVLRHVRGLTEVTASLGRGDLDARIGPPRPPGEVGVLADTFNRMAASLAQRQQEAEQARATLRATYAMLAAVFDAAPVAVTALDLDRRVVLWSHAAERMFGWTPAEVSGTVNPIVPADHVADTARLWGRLRAGDVVLNLEMRRVARDGTPVDVSVSAAPLYDSARTIVGAVFVYADVRDRRRAEEALARHRAAAVTTEKMAALGRLAAGVAHELRNPLTVIVGHASFVTTLLATDADAAPHLLAIAEAVERMSSIVQGLSTYSRPTPAVRGPVDVSRLIESTRQLIASEARRAKVVVETHVVPATLTVYGDRSQLTQVLLNLALNAIDAMSETQGGRLTLRACDAGGAVRLDVVDTGPGIAAERRDTIWEPFSTTKAEGTGLGLSIVRAIVTGHGGTIDVASAPGRGAVFTIAIPRCVDEHTENDGSTAHDGRLRGGRAVSSCRAVSSVGRAPDF